MTDTSSAPRPGDWHHDTMQYGEMQYGEHPTPPLAGPPPADARPPGRSGRAKFAAAVVATSLLVGGAAGVGGAAAYDAWQPDESSGSATTTRTTSQVVDTPDQAAADGTIAQVAQEVLPSVVKIEVSSGQGSGSGSGIVLSSDGQILTNDHVVEAAGDSGAISVSFNDGSSAPAKILGTDPLTDTAVIQAEGVDGLTPITIGKSSDLQVGEGVVAIGSPFGLESTVTTGIVSALDRPVDVGSDSEGNSTTYPAIQTDAAINPGNSGGPLVDMNGHLVGINSSIRTSSSSTEQGGSIGLGFAIPIDEVNPIVEQMINGETPTHARLGIQVSDVADSAGTGAATEGAQIQEVTSGSTADSAGLQEGDVITKVDDNLITGADSLVATIRSYRPGDTVTVTYERDGDTRTAELELDSDASGS
jgi:putative serine protease PepD